MNPALLSPDARLPRYTSYPTAPHFHAGINAAIYRGWLAEIPRDMPLSLYLHVPFCDTLCWFCGCHTKVVNTYSPVSAYMDALVREIETVADVLGDGRLVTHIHFGGGSPTILSPEDIDRLSALLHRHFAIAPDAEIAIEIDPRGLKDETIAALARLGVNRASIGVQDFATDVQKAINRIQTYECTKDAIDRLRAAGIRNLNIDLIYGLPHQTDAGLKETIEKSLTFRPGRFAIFGYAHVPHFKAHQRLIDECALPRAAERVEQFELARQVLSAAGYVPIGIDHFALPQDSLAAAQREGSLARNFQGYTTDDAPAIVAFGASAIGKLPQGYVQNESDPRKYREATLTGELTVMRGVAVTADDKARRAVIERIMCDLRVDLDTIAMHYGFKQSDFASELADLKILADEGYVILDGSIVRVTDRAYARAIGSLFDTYLARGEAVHSVAV